MEDRQENSKKVKINMEYWLKPIFILLGVFVFIALLVEALPTAFPDVSWSTINPNVIAVLPWLIAFGLGLFVLVVVTSRRR